MERGSERGGEGSGKSGRVEKTLTFRTEVRKTEQPIKVKIMKPVTLCSRIPKK